jgi:hypothetical protein
MKATFAVATVLAATVSTASAQLYGGGTGLYGTGSNPNTHAVRPYVTPQGTYVQPHHQTNPNNTQLDNFSTRGHVTRVTKYFGTTTSQ